MGPKIIITHIDPKRNLISDIFIPLDLTNYYCFALLLNPWYVTELTDIKTFHQSKNIDTKVLVQIIMLKFYEYIMSVELAANPNTPQILVVKNEDSLYLHNNPNRIHPISPSIEDW